MADYLNNNLSNNLLYKKKKINQNRVKSLKIEN